MAFIVISAVCDIKTGHILAYEDTSASSPEYAIDVGFFDNFKKVEKFVKTELKNWQDSGFNNRENANLQFRFDAVNCSDKKLESQLTQYIISSKSPQPCLGELNIEFCNSPAVYRGRMADIKSNEELLFVYGKDYDEEIRSL